MPGVLEVLGACYELSTVVTDIVLNHEYIQRKWIEEYALSIAFLVFNGVVMAVVGLQLEAKAPTKRYVRWGPLNASVGAVIGLLQLRVLVETVYTYVASAQAEKEDSAQAQQQQQQHALPTAGSTPYHQQLPTGPHETATERAARLERGRLYVAFIQAMVRDVPVFVIQANATIHYRKWQFLDLWAVASTGVTLLNAFASYVTATPATTTHTAPPPKPSSSVSSSTLLRATATLFLLGQFVFRLGAILLVATTTGLAIVAYASVLTALAIAAAIALRLATPAQATSAQVASAVLFFPLFTVFAVDAAHMGPVVGDVTRALVSRKLLLLHAWRVVENAGGVVLAVALPRYTDFGKSSDQEIALIGLGCAAFYVVSLVVFMVAARATPTGKEDDAMEEDTTLYLQNAPAPTAPSHRL